ncbi:TPA: response regulator transcription factor [Pseudomonas aeruginosa]|nr:response regulator transcription factor [Pseudomonas aeruginosa]
MRVLLIEDDPRMSAILSEVLSGNGMTVDISPDLRTARAALQEHPYRLVLLDLQLPDGDGRSLIQFAKGIDPQLPILILTAKYTISDRVRGLDMGADDYLTKPFAVAELMARIRAVSRRPAQQKEPLLVVGNLRFDAMERRFFVGNVDLRLQRRPMQILEALVLRHGRTVSRSALIEAVYGFDEDISSNSVEAHISRLRKTLVDHRAGVRIHVMRGLGYLLEAVD